jgi:hypothetical protein
MIATIHYRAPTIHDRAAERPGFLLDSLRDPRTVRLPSSDPYPCLNIWRRDRALMRAFGHSGLSAVFALQDWFPGGPYHPRFTRFDNPLAATAFPADALPFDGHWGATQRGPTYVRADWLVPPVGPIPARDL